MKKTLENLLSTIPNPEILSLARTANQVGVTIDEWAAESYADNPNITKDAKRNNFLSILNRAGLKPSTVLKHREALDRVFEARRRPTPPPPPAASVAAPVYIAKVDPFIVDALATMNEKLDRIVAKLFPA